MTAVMFILAGAACAQYERVEVVQVDSVGAGELYRRAERWFADAFRDAQEVVQLRDTVARTIVGKGAEEFRYAGGNGWSGYYRGEIRFKYSIEVGAKDGRYRARVYDVTLNDGEYRADTCCFGSCDPTVPKKAMEKRAFAISMDMKRQVCPQADAFMGDLLASLRAAMLKPKEDW